MSSSPKIVVLDGYTLNPGDLSWDPLKQLGACQIYDRTPPDQVLPRALEAQIILTNKTPLAGPILNNLPVLQYIGILATGYNIVDVDAARKRSIPVTNVPTYGTRSVAQMTFALILELAHHAGAHSQSARNGDWLRSPDFSYWNFPLIELDGLTLGIVGFGRIGRTVAELGKAFGMQLMAHTPHPPPEPVESVLFADLPTLLQASDIVSLHCPLTVESRELINGERLALMKRSAFLINTSRGPLIDEQALAKALNHGQIAGAALDVLSVEPPPETNPLLSARNCLITPHIAWATRAARHRLMSTAVENVQAFLAGKLQNVVNR